MKARHGNVSVCSVAQCLLLCFALSAATSAAEGTFRAELPMAISSCGQSPDAYAVSLLCKRVKLEHVYNNVLRPEGLKGLRALVIVIGGSAKGLGEAGIDEKAEIERVNTLLSRAKEQGIQVIGAHVGGESRRGPLSDKFIEPVAGKADYLIVTEDGNRDGLFTKIAKDRGIPLVLIKQMAAVGKELKQLFTTPR